MSEVDEGSQHVCNFSQSIRDIRYACHTRLLGVKVEIHQLPIFANIFLVDFFPHQRWAFGPERLVHLFIVGYFNNVDGAPTCHSSIGIAIGCQIMVNF